MSELDKYIKGQIENTQFEVDPVHLQDIEDRLKKKRRNPFFFWLFSGIFIMAILGGLIYFIDQDRNEIVEKEEIAKDNKVSSGSKEIIDGKLDRSFDDTNEKYDQKAKANSIKEGNKRQEFNHDELGDDRLQLQININKQQIAESSLLEDPINREGNQIKALAEGFKEENKSGNLNDTADRNIVNENIISKSGKSAKTALIESQIPLLKTLSFTVYKTQDRVIDIFDETYMVQINRLKDNEKPSDIDLPKLALGPAFNLEYFPSLFHDNIEDQTPLGYFGGLKLRYLIGEKIYLEASGFYGERRGGFVYEKSAENDFAGLRSRTPRNSLDMKTLRYFRLDLDAVQKLGRHELIGGVGLKLLQGGKGDATYHVQGLSNEIESVMITDQWLETDGLRRFLPDLHLGYGYQFDFGLNIRLDVRAHWPKHNFPTLSGDDRFLYTKEFNWIYPSLTMSYLFSKK